MVKFNIKLKNNFQVNCVANQLVQEGSEREALAKQLNDKLETEIRDREEVNEALTDALQVMATLLHI